MPATLRVVQAANLFCGDADPTDSKHLSIVEFVPPTLEEMKQDHHAGGSFFAIKMSVGGEALEAKFKLTGMDVPLLMQFGLNTPSKRMYTAYAVEQDKRTGTHIELKYKMEGRLCKVEKEAFKRGELPGIDYEISEITHYELFEDGEEKQYWDFFTNTWRVNGVDQYADQNRILHIPNTAG